MNIDESQNVFYKKGFSNWNKALEKFAKHEKSKDHLNAISNKMHEKNNLPIEAQLNAQIISEQEKSRSCLVEIFYAIKYLARQNLALRGHVDHESNFMQLITILKK